MEVTRIAGATSYPAAKHHDVTGFRLQGFDVSNVKAFWVGLSHYEPGGRAERDASGTEKVYVVIEGEITVITDAGDAVLGPLAEHGALDNNVGILVVKPLAEHTVEDFDRLMHINCWSYLQATQRIAPEMQKTGGGSIINISSIGGLVALPMVAAYCASKAAVIGLTRSIAHELAPDIRCNVICPGGVETPMSAGHIAGFGDRDEAIRLTTGRRLQKRFANPREIAEAVVFLASDESSFMTAAVVPVEAGHSAW